MPFCGSCGKSISDTSQFCSSCGSSFTTANQETTKSKAENILLDENGFFVSNARFVNNKQTYAISGVTSVNQFIEQPSRKWPVIITIVGALFFLENLLLFHTAIGVILGAMLILLGVWLYRRKVPLYGVVLHSASGQQRAAQCTDRLFIDRIITALNQAIILRG
jgi:Family of unknown function (DUF6232)/zinc-ribbon domain